MTDLLHTWSPSPSPALADVQIEDDTLRDGLQGAFTRRPSTEEKIALLRGSAAIGIRFHMLGFPASSPADFEECRALLAAARGDGLAIVPRFLARARPEDVDPIARLADEAGIEVWADVFIATGPLRRRVEGWAFDEVLARVEETAAHLRRRGCRFGVSLEDASRTPPDDLLRAVDLAIGSGAGYLTVCDTAGETTPQGARRLVRFVLDRIAGRPVTITWHGHDDRGLALGNAIAAAEEGAHVVSGSFLGIGERSGNTALEQMIAYVHQMGGGRFRVDRLVEHCQRVAAAVRVDIPPNAPLIGRQAFATCTGTHAAAILKARRLGVAYEDLVFSAVPAGMLGRAQELWIGPTSGMALARHVLQEAGLRATDEHARRLLDHAKRQDRWLELDAVRALFAEDA